MDKGPFYTWDVVDTGTFNIGQDWEVPIPAFFIIRLNRKAKSITDFTEAESIEFMKLLRCLRNGMREALGIKEVYIFQNEDTSHGFHVWVFPRHAWMEPFGRKIQSVRPIMEHATAKRMTPDVLKEVRKSVDVLAKYFTKNYE